MPPVGNYTCAREVVALRDALNPATQRAKRKPKPAVPLGSVKPAAFYVPVNHRDYTHLFEQGEVERVHYFLNLVRWGCINWQADGDGFTRLKWDHLERVITRALLNGLIGRLEKAGVVNTDESCRKGKCYGYRVTPAYRETRRHVCTDEELNRRIFTVYAENRPALLPVHDWLRGQLDALAFDTVRAESIISVMVPDAAETTITVVEYRELIREQVRGIADGERDLIRDRYGRVHTPVTRLPTQLRCCLSASGRPLVGLDLKNSQSLMLGLVAREYYRDRMAASRLRARDFGGVGNPYGHFKSSGVTIDAVEPYIRDCESGGFYEGMMRPGESRPAFKVRFFTEVFFGKPTKRPQGLFRRFQKKYPEVANVLLALKTDDYERAAWVMQNAESTLFIGRVAARIMQERPETTLVTIHDSFLTTAADLPFVRSVLLDEFSRQAVTPNFTTEDYR